MRAISIKLKIIETLPFGFNKVNEQHADRKPGEEEDKCNHFKQQLLEMDDSAQGDLTKFWGLFCRGLYLLFTNWVQGPYYKLEVFHTARACE